MNLLIVCIHFLDISSSKTWETLGAFRRTVMLNIATPIGQGAFPIDRSMYLSFAWMYYLTKQQFMMWYIDRIISLFPPLFLRTCKKLRISDADYSYLVQLSWCFYLSYSVLYFCSSALFQSRKILWNHRKI